MYVGNGIFQKVISEYAYNILNLCKIGGINDIEKYIKEELNITYLTSFELYRSLSEVVIEVCDGHQLEELIRKDIPEYLKFKKLQNLEEKSVLTYEDLCQILIKKLLLLRVIVRKRRKAIDLFLINYNNRILTIDEYESVNKEEKQKEYRSK